jgi:hypothetical protein
VLLSNTAFVDEKGGCSVIPSVALRVRSALRLGSQTSRNTNLGEWLTQINAGLVFFAEYRRRRKTFSRTKKNCALSEDRWHRVIVTSELYTETGSPTLHGRREPGAAMRATRGRRSARAPRSVSLRSTGRSEVARSPGVFVISRATSRMP